MSPNEFTALHDTMQAIRSVASVLDCLLEDQGRYGDAAAMMDDVESLLMHAQDALNADTPNRQEIAP